MNLHRSVIHVQTYLCSNHFKMADPLSITASVIAIATVGFQLASSLSYMAEKVKGAPKTIASTAEEMISLSRLMDELGQLLDKNRVLYTLRLVEVVQSIVSRFGSVQNTLTEILSSCHGIKRLRIVFKGKQIEDIRITLKGLETTMALALQIITLRKDEQREHMLVMIVLMV